MSKALEKGISVLEYISGKRACTITEIANALGMNKSTVSRIIKTFIQKDMVEINRLSGMYSVGPAILQMSSNYYKSRNILVNIKGVMETLCRQVGESVHLCALSNDGAVIVEQVESSNRLVVNAKIGNREPLHASAVGKCLLAFTDGRERETMLAGYSYEKYTSKTITDEKTLLAELEKIKKEGFAIDDNELTPDIRCVAVPIIDTRKNCLYSLGVSGANSHMTVEKMDFIIKKLTAAVKSLMEAL
ncbi:MAG: IclR family transcriptional regulator [Clostridiales bacterium]|mgnify:CR=1 FL=1|jgi:DNA-binding IclR family transcriptional regulator|nr:IclR family transcriptional regulator [Clostridiales bacterium]HOB64557.1 IclR family transcriptional regulator [Clostridia bacterium]HOK82466.1 IclR family transcriptional regulator [Clostridia bacterium]HOL61597.1 IclR family transcriptional regulator [Clostridia bacterium]HPO54215.1 IclR family transcriptional regulator [Clostridia bacterium]